MITSLRSKDLLPWSAGKDSVWALHVLHRQPDLEVVNFLITFHEAFDRVVRPAVRRKLVEAQTTSAGLSLIPVLPPFPCTNEVYEDRRNVALVEAKAGGGMASASPISSRLEGLA